MPRRREFTEGERAQMVLLWELGYDANTIANKLKCARHTVNRAVKRFRQAGEHHNKPRSGRKRVTSYREDRKLIRESLRNRRKTSSVLSADLSEQTGRVISSRTVRRRLLNAGLRGCKARKKPWLSQKNKEKRLKWARQHQNWSEEDWSNVIWSDESNFEV